jgi:carbon starvation protein
MLQDLLGNLWAPLGRTGSLPANVLASALIVAGWGYFLYQGVVDPLGGINILWPLFGIANQMLAGIALAIATAIFLKTGRARYCWVTGAPLAWLAIVTSTAAWQKLFSVDPKIGFLSGAADLAEKLAAGALAADKAAVAGKLIVNLRIDAALTAFFLLVLWVVILDMLNIAWRASRGARLISTAEAPYQRTQYAGAANA